MKKLFLISAILILSIFSVACAGNNTNLNSSSKQPTAQSVSTLEGKKVLVAYFSATNTTKKIAEDIAAATGGDLYRIEAADPYSPNPYDSNDRIKQEAFNHLRPAVKNPLPAEEIAKYDVIFIGSPIWWHQPAMVVTTFLESYSLDNKIIVPFFTYQARTYLNEAMQRIYQSTPHSIHIPEKLPEDLDPQNIQEPQNDDNGIIMPDDVENINGWLNALKLK